MWQTFLTSLTETNSGINLLEVGAAVVIAVVLGVIVFFTHKFTTDVFSYDKNFGLVMLFVPATVALLVSITSNSISRALSIAGVLAIIRYRSTLTNPRDLVYIFFSVAVGFAAGVGLYAGALIFVVIGAIVAAIYGLCTAEKTKNVKKTLKIAVPESINYDGMFDGVLAKYTSGYKTEGVRIISGGTVTEIIYSIKIKDTKDTKAFIDELRTLNANFKITLQEWMPLERLV
ncbi:MAG: DUF4956 domain-containing protein [Clostridia bacterium]|nr:DUF4956 domain-containing protein [Clostridia bacterium]